MTLMVEGVKMKSISNTASAIRSLTFNIDINY